jgi:hypothetical protein
MVWAGVRACSIAASTSVQRCVVIVVMI